MVDPQPMYNLTVDEAHTFFVGDGEWLVHNTCEIRNDGGTYYAIDTELPDVYLGTSNISNDNYMEFAIYTEEIPTQIRGGEVFTRLADTMIKDIGGIQNVTGVRGIWLGKSTNLVAFNNNLASALSEADSARLTFTGHMASKSMYGFSRVTFESIKWVSDGPPRRASEVIVLFER